MPAHLETRRLLLRPFGEADAAAAFQWFGDREAMRYSPNGPDRSVARTQARLQVYRGHQRIHGFSRWILLDRDSGRAIGDAGLLHLTGTGEIELRYRLAPHWWNRGLATEAAQAWLRHGLEVLGIPRIIARAHPGHAASLRVLEKLEFVLQRNHEMADAHARVYSLANPRRCRPPAAAVLDTSRLHLREMGTGDLDFMASLLAHPEVMRYYPACCTREESEDWLRRQQERYARYGFGFWLAIEKATGRPVGQAGILMQDVEGRQEICLGYMLDRGFWGLGLATEAAAASCDYVFDTLGEAELLCLVRPENQPSQAVARRLGMALRGRTQYIGFPHLVFALGRDQHRHRTNLPR